jgi:hypothetical protein
MITVCTTQNVWGILEGFIFHIMPDQWKVKVRKRGEGLGNVPRQKVTSRTVTVMQYRIAAQYV